MKATLSVYSYFKYLTCGIITTTLAIIFTSCGDGLHVSPVFEGVDLELILVGSKKHGDIPELRASTSIKPEYNFKDCELFLPIPGHQTSNNIVRIISECTNSIVRLGGTILSHTNSNHWESHRLAYETARTKGLLHLYSAEAGNSKTKLIAVMLECPN